jgi:two-component system chemotaxis response regulator CheB
MPAFDLVVIGTSVGGVEALCSIVEQLPSDLDAAVLIAMHVGQSSVLPSILARRGSLPCEFATDDPQIETGHIYVAPPDYHMRVGKGRIGLFKGPKENHCRPSINPLFRSAAQIYGQKVVGVILTGALSDGAAGLSAVKAAKGIAIIQDPEEAFAPSMPREAMRQTKVDYRLPISEIGPLLVRLIGVRDKNIR